MDCGSVSQVASSFRLSSLAVSREIFSPFLGRVLAVSCPFYCTTNKRALRFLDERLMAILTEIEEAFPPGAERA
jgi:hypothetical protein